ncbi:MAG: molecular chaperone DnaJ [Candidatus Promineifilaceae bacterium]
MMAKRDYYEVLGVNQSSTPSEIKKAYRRMARKFHPDVNKAPEAEEKFKEINEAYDVLSTDQKKAAYDRYGHQAFEGGMGGASGFDFDLNDIFEGIFNNFSGGGGGRRRRNGPRRGADLRYDLELEFEEAIFGVDKVVDITRPEVCGGCQGSGAEPGTAPSRCQHCSGSGEVRRVQQSILGSFVNVTTCPVCEGSGEMIETPCKTCRGRKQVSNTKQLSVKVPAGVDEETQIRLTGEGAPGVHGGPAGNLYVVMNIKPHKFFRRQGNDILLDLEVNVAQAALGAEVAAPSVDGDESLKIPAGTQSGTVFKMRGKGVPYLRRGGRGDQLVVVQVQTPQKLTDEQRELFTQLAATMGTEPVISTKKKGFFESLREALFD